MRNAILGNHHKKNCELSTSSLMAPMQKLSSVLIFPLISMSKTVKESKRHRTKPKELPVTLILSHGHDKLSQGTIARPTKTVIYIGLCMVRVQI